MTTEYEDEVVEFAKQFEYTTAAEKLDALAKIYAMQRRYDENYEQFRIRVKEYINSKS